MRMDISDNELGVFIAMVEDFKEAMDIHPILMLRIMLAYNKVVLLDLIEKEKDIEVKDISKKTIDYFITNFQVAIDSYYYEGKE